MDKHILFFTINVVAFMLEKLFWKYWYIVLKAKNEKIHNFQTILYKFNIWITGASEDFPAFPTPGKLEFSHSSSQELSDLDINPEDNSSMAIEEVDMDDWFV